MKVHFRQIYIEPGVTFPFSCDLQRRLAREVSALVEPSAKFLKKYGDDFELTFNVSAKSGIDANEIRGPSVFRRAKDVEYTIFLPFDLITRDSDVPVSADVMLRCPGVARSARKVPRVWRLLGFQPAGDRPVES